MRFFLSTALAVATLTLVIASDVDFQNEDVFDDDWWFDDPEDDQIARRAVHDASGDHQHGGDGRSGKHNPYVDILPGGIFGGPPIQPNHSPHPAKNLFNNEGGGDSGQHTHQGSAQYTLPARIARREPESGHLGNQRGSGKYSGGGHPVGSHAGGGQLGGQHQQRPSHPNPGQLFPHGVDPKDNHDPPVKGPPLPTKRLGIHILPRGLLTHDSDIKDDIEDDFEDDFESDESYVVPRQIMNQPLVDMKGRPAIPRPNHGGSSHGDGGRMRAHAEGAGEPNRQGTVPERHNHRGH